MVTSAEGQIYTWSALTISKTLPHISQAQPNPHGSLIPPFLGVESKFLASVQPLSKALWPRASGFPFLSPKFFLCKMKQLGRMGLGSLQ